MKVKMKTDRPVFDENVYIQLYLQIHFQLSFNKGCKGHLVIFVNCRGVSCYLLCVDKKFKNYRELFDTVSRDRRRGEDRGILR